MENTANILLFCDSKVKKIQREIVLLRIKKRKHLFNIRLHKLMQNYYTQLLNSRLEWVHIRHGKFWEEDVPNLSDEAFRENFRMSRQTFQLLCSKLGAMQKMDTNYRKCIPLQKRVAIGLYCLKSSSEYASMAHMFGVSKASVCEILQTFCIEVWTALSEEYLSPDVINEETIKECVNGFQKMGFPQCFGAIDLLIAINESDRSKSASETDDNSKEVIYCESASNIENKHVTNSEKKSYIENNEAVRYSEDNSNASKNSSITINIPSSSSCKHNTNLIITAAPNEISNTTSPTNISSKAQSLHMKDQLLYLAKLLGFEVDFSDYPKGNHNEFLTIVMLSTNPPQICHGVGLNSKESREDAARNALKILSEMGLNT